MGPEEDRQEVWLSWMICLGVVSIFHLPKEKISVASGESVYDNPVPLGGSAFRQIRNFRNSAQNNSYAKMAYFEVSYPDSLNSIFIGVDAWNEV